MTTHVTVYMYTGKTIVELLVTYIMSSL